MSTQYRTPYVLPSTANVLREELDNGIVVLIHENHNVESVVVYGSLRAGCIYEPAEQNGLASMTAAGLLRGTRSRDFDAIHSLLEDTGADLTINSGKHTVSFGGKSLAEDLPLVLDILNDALRHPVFPDEEIEQQRMQRLTELRYSQQDSRYRATEAFREALYPPESVYHYTSYGKPETVARIQPEDLRAFHARHYGPQGMILAIVGAIDAGATAARVREVFSDWRSPQQPPEPAAPAIALPTDRQRVRVTLPGKSQSDIVMGVPGPSRHEQDYLAALLANSILGEFGMMGRVGDRIRERAGLAYYAYSRLEGGQGSAPWTVVAGVAPDDVDRAIAMALEEVERIVAEPVTPEELGDNQSYFTGRLPLRLENIGGIAITLQTMERFGLGLDYLLHYHDLIYALTPQDLLDAARRYLKPEQMVIAVAGPG